MLGKQQLTIAAADFLKGAGSSDYSNDGGFSPSSTGLNLNYKQGAVYGFPAPTNITTPVSDFVASCPDNGNGVIANARYFVDSSANYYSLAGTTLTKQKTGTATTHYNFGLVDMVPYNGSYYVSRDNDVAQWDGTTTLLETWYTVTKSKSFTLTGPHPMLSYKGILYIADGRYLGTYDGTTVTPAVLDLGSGQVIYALGIDPSSGNILISSQRGVNGALSSSAESYVWLYDGGSLTPARQIPTNELVTSFVNVAGTTYVGMGQYIGYWDGSGVQTIRKLQNVSYIYSCLLYKPHITSSGNTLYYIDGNSVWALGPLGEAQSLWMRVQRVFYPVYAQPSSFLPNGTLGLVCGLGGGKLGIYANLTSFGTTTYNLFVLDTTTSGVYAGTFTSNRYEFPRPVVINKIRVFTTGVTTGASGTVQIINNDSLYISPTVSSFTVTSGQSPRYVFDFDFQTKLQTAQFIVSLPTQAVGINRVMVYYTIAE